MRERPLQVYSVPYEPSSVPQRPSASQHPRTSIERPSTSRHALRSEERYYAEEPSQVTLTRLGFPYCDKAAITHGMILSHPRNVLPRSLPVLPARVLDLSLSTSPIVPGSSLLVLIGLVYVLPRPYVTASERPGFIHLLELQLSITFRDRYTP